MLITEFKEGFNIDTFYDGLIRYISSMEDMESLNVFSGDGFELYKSVSFFIDNYYFSIYIMKTLNDYIKIEVCETTDRPELINEAILGLIENN